MTIDSYKTGNKHILAAILNFCTVPEEKGKILKISFILSIVFIIAVFPWKRWIKQYKVFVFAQKLSQTNDKHIYKVKTTGLKII